MVPSADRPFFAASTGAAAALLGLLFVAVSIAPERTVGAGAPVERQIVAESVFTALINAFFVSMGGTIPGFNLGAVAIALSIFSLVQTLRGGRRLWPRRFADRSVIQRLVLVAVALTIYGLQFYDASQLVLAPNPASSVGNEINLLFALYAFAIGRSWELIGARRGILASRLNPILDDARDQGPTAPRGIQPSAPTETPDVTVGEGTTNS